MRLRGTHPDTVGAGSISDTSSLVEPTDAVGSIRSVSGMDGEDGAPGPAGPPGAPGSGGDGYYDGTSVSNSSELQAALDAAAVSFSKVRLYPGQLIEATSTVTVPHESGIVCPSSLPGWTWGAAPDSRPKIVAQAGFTGPMLFMEGESQGIVLEGFELDGADEPGVTFGIFMEESHLEKSYQFNNLTIRRVIDGAGMAGRMTTSELNNVNIFNCHYGIQAGTYGRWTDSRWFGGFIAFCTGAGAWLDGAAQLQFVQVRVERCGEGEPTPAGVLPTITHPDAPGWYITEASNCSWTSCNTDANAGPAVHIEQLVPDEGTRTTALLFTGCNFVRDGQGDNVAVNPATSFGVKIDGYPDETGVGWAKTIRFVNCNILPGERYDNGLYPFTYFAPYTAVSVDRCSYFTWIGDGYGSDVNFNLNDWWLYEPVIVNNTYNGSTFVGIPRADSVVSNSADGIIDGFKQFEQDLVVPGLFSSQLILTDNAEVPGDTQWFWTNQDGVLTLWSGEGEVAPIIVAADALDGSLSIGSGYITAVAPISAENNQIFNVADPVNATDAANLNYLSTNYVNNANNETIAGVKTFSAPPVFPDIYVSNQVIMTRDGNTWYWGVNADGNISLFNGETTNVPLLIEADAGDGGLVLSSGYIYITVPVDASGQQFYNVNNIVPSKETTVSAAGVLTLGTDSAQVQEITGTTTHTVSLPSTNVGMGMEWKISNRSTGAVAVQSSDATAVATVAAGDIGVFVSKVDTPELGTHWAVVVNA